MAVAMRDQPATRSSRDCAGDRILARRIDIGDGDHVGLVEAGAEILEQVRQARIAVRLVNGDHPALGGLTRGLQHGGDLYRVVAVIVDDGDAAQPRPPW
jgi:hypothetical protein